MSLDIDVPTLIKSLETTASGILQKDIASVQGFARSQLEAMATQAKIIAGGIATGQIREDLHQFFLDQLKASAETFIRTLVGLTLITLEKLWNGVVGALWGAIAKATGLNLTPPPPPNGLS